MGMSLARKYSGGNLITGLFLASFVVVAMDGFVGSLDVVVVDGSVVGEEDEPPQPLDDEEEAVLLVPALFGDMLDSLLSLVAQFLC